MRISSIWKRLFNEYRNDGINSKDLDAWLSWRTKVNQDKFSNEEIEQHVFSNWQKIEAQLYISKIISFNKVKKIIYLLGGTAAAIVFGIVLFSYLNKQSSVKNKNEQWGQPAIAGATLNLNHAKLHIDKLDLNYKIAQDKASEVYTCGGNLVFKPIHLSAKKNYSSEGSIQTPYQRTINIVFSDNVSVRLNAGSILFYTINHNYSAFHFEIQGEGYFNVMHHRKNTSLEVLANGHIIKDIGTQFIIENYNTEELKVSVKQGLVAVDKLAYLKMGEGYYFKEDIPILLDSNLTSLNFAWLDNKFKFRSITLKDLMAKIGRWYNVSYSFSDDISMNTFTGSFPMDITLLDVIKILKNTGKMNLTIRNKTVIISKP